MSDRDRFAYSVYGLTIRSNLKLLGLIPSSSDAHHSPVQVNLSFLPESLDEIPDSSSELYYERRSDYQADPELTVRRVGNGAYWSLDYAYGVRFVIDRQGTTVWGTWTDTLGLDDALLFLIGPVLGFVLRLRGITALHASGAVVAGRALIFAGPSGAGKSTFAAILARRGHKILGDDIMPLQPHSGGLRVASGYPRLRLRPDVVERLYGREDALPRFVPDWERRCLDLASENLGFSTGTTPVGTIYLLERDENLPADMSTGNLPAPEALALLAVNTVRTELLTEEMRRQEFDCLAELLRHVPVRRLQLRPGLADLPNIASRIVDEYRELIRVQH